MKKIFFLFLILGILGFSNDLNLDGYKNFKWGTDKKVITKSLGTDYTADPTLKGVIVYKKNTKIGNFEFSELKVSFKDDKLFGWLVQKNTSYEEFMDIVGSYAGKYGDKFYFSDYGKSGASFTYFDALGMLEIHAKPLNEKEVEMYVFERTPYTETEKATWISDYNEHKELNEAANKAIQKGNTFKRDANPYTRETDRTVK